MISAWRKGDTGVQAAEEGPQTTETGAANQQFGIQARGTVRVDPWGG